MDIDVGQISEALNNKIDIDGYNSNTTTPVGLNANGTRTVVEVSDKSLMPSWYRVYSDGWCEQGGKFGTGVTSVTFLKTFANTPNMYTESISTSSNSVSGSVPTTTGFTCASYSSTSRMWQASGYIE